MYRQSHLPLLFAPFGRFFTKWCSLRLHTRSIKWWKISCVWRRILYIVQTSKLRGKKKLKKIFSFTYFFPMGITDFRFCWTRGREQIGTKADDQEKRGRELESVCGRGQVFVLYERRRESEREGMGVGWGGGGENMGRETTQNARHVRFHWALESKKLSWPVKNFTRHFLTKEENLTRN